MTLLLSENEIEGLLDMPSTLEAVESVLRQHAEGRATNRARRRVALPTGGLNFMAAGAPEIGALGLKAYSVARTGARFYTLLFDPEGGELLSIMQSDRLGQVRTGAASGVATKHLAREDANTLGIYGAGWQAESQLEAITAVRDLDRVIVYTRSEESRKAFAEKMGLRWARPPCTPSELPLPSPSPCCSSPPARRHPTSPTPPRRARKSVE
jgi:ornithine cyclodeaminase/alanine dehydrogenase